jgi:hypothetical protein
MDKAKRFFITLLVLSGLLMGTVMLFAADPPEPKCVCAECGHPCGSGHASNCSSK